MRRALRARRAGWLIAALALAGCTTTYGPGDPPPEPAAEAKPVCGEDDQGEGCAMENPVCLDAEDYLCDP